MSSYTWQTTPIEFEDEEIGGAHAAEAGEFTVAIERWKSGSDTTPLFKGLPEDSCQAPHWGYLVEGRFKVTSKEGEEVVSAGQAYYLPPGHNIVIEEDVEIVEFTPTAERNITMEHVANAMGANA